MDNTDIDWDIVECVARETGRAICIGKTSEFSRREKSAMSKEACERNLNIRYGNPYIDPEERTDELFVMAKL